MRLLLTCSLAVLLTVPSASAASSPWTVVHSANNGSDANYLSGIDALAPGDVWAVGSFRDQETSQFVTLAEHWDGTSWSLTATPNRNWGYNELNGVAASSADDVWAVGYDNAGNYGTERTLVEHWDGAAWSVVASPNIGTNASILYDAASVAADDVWAVGVGNSASAGSGKPLIARWNGTRWKLVRNPATGQGGSWLAGLAVLSATNVWAVGGAGNSTLVEHWNGTSWKIVPSPDGPSGPSALRSVAAASKNDVWAVGSSGDETLIEHWNGSSWSVVPSPNGDLDETELTGVAALSGRNAWAVGASYDSISGSGPAISLRWNGTAWTPVATPNPDPGYDWLSAIAAVPSTHVVWAAGSAGDRTMTITAGR